MKSFTNKRMANTTERKKLRPIRKFMYTGILFRRQPRSDSVTDVINIGSSPFGVHMISRSSSSEGDSLIQSAIQTMSQLHSSGLCFISMSSKRNLYWISLGRLFN